MQLSMFVDYTWQRMKLPVQPPVLTATGAVGGAVGGAVEESVKVKLNTFSIHRGTGSYDNDVTIAVADSTTHGRPPCVICHDIFLYG